jgi:hypothetical protein
LWRGEEGERERKRERERIGFDDFCKNNSGKICRDKAGFLKVIFCIMFSKSTINIVFHMLECNFLYNIPSHIKK